MLKNLHHFILMFKQEKPGEPSVIINKNDIVITTKQRGYKCRIPNIIINNIKNIIGHNNGFIQWIFVHLCTYTKFT